MTTAPPIWLVALAGATLALVLAVLVHATWPQRRQVDRPSARYRSERRTVGRSRPRAGVARPAAAGDPGGGVGRLPLLPVGVALVGVVAVRAGAGQLGTLLTLAGGGWLLHAYLARRRTAERRAKAAAEAAPAVVDLLAACLLAGLNAHLALVRVAERTPEPLRSELQLAVAALRWGRSPAAALRGAAERTGLAELRAAAGALEAAERWGAPPAEALTARAAALRVRLQLEAEAAAGRAAVRLTFPLVLCFLPAFVLLTVVPLIVGAIEALTR